MRAASQVGPSFLRGHGVLVDATSFISTIVWPSFKRRNGVLVYATKFMPTIV